MTAPYIRAETCCSKTLQYKKSRVSSLQQDVPLKSVLILFCITAVTIRIPLGKKLDINCSKMCLLGIMVLVIWTGVYWGADMSLSRPGRKQATATEDFEFHVAYL